MRSRKVAEVVGLTFEGTLRGVRFFEGRRHDDAIYALVSDGAAPVRSLEN